MNVNSIASPLVHSSFKRRKNTWYSIKSGNWSDPSIWVCNGSHNSKFPGQNTYVPYSSATATIIPTGDDVYIGLGHTITLTGLTVLNTNIPSYYINNLFISGTLILSLGNSLNIQVNGNLQALGTLDMSGSSVISTFVLMGINNFVNTYVAGGRVVYNSLFRDQPLMSLTYQRLEIYPDEFISFPLSGANTEFTRYFTGDITTNENFGTTAYNGYSYSIKTELGIYNLTVGGTTGIGNHFSKTGAGNILFIGNVNINGGLFELTGNPTVEHRGGLTYSTNQPINTGTGLWSFTTNNQNLAFGTYEFHFTCPISIVGAITITNTTQTGIMTLHDVMNGTVAGSTFVNSGKLYFATSAAVSGVMTTGVFNYLNTGSILGYSMSGSFTLPYTSYYGLYAGGTGTKTLLGNTTLTEGLAIESGTTLDCNTFNLTVGTTSNIRGILSKTTSGALIFGGLITINNAGSTGLDFSGNPTVELKGGIHYSSNNNPLINMGTGGWTLSTNNQNWSGSLSSNTVSANLLISGAITITYGTGGLGGIFTGTIDGNNAASTWLMASGSTLQYQNAVMPLATTGILDTNTNANTFKYNKNGNQDVKGGTYRTIEFGGSGNKTLQGNVIVNVSAGGSQSTTGTAVVVLNGFTITTI